MDESQRPFSPRAYPLAGNGQGGAPNGTSTVIAASASDLLLDADQLPTGRTSVLDALPMHEQDQGFLVDSEPVDDPLDSLDDDEAPFLPGVGDVTTDLPDFGPVVAEPQAPEPQVQQLSLTASPTTVAAAPEVIVKPDDDLSARIASMQRRLAKKEASTDPDDLEDAALYRRELHELISQMAVIDEKKVRLDTITTLKARRAGIIGLDPDFDARIKAMCDEQVAHEQAANALKVQIKVLKHEAEQKTSASPEVAAADEALRKYVADCASWWEGQLYARGPNEFRTIAVGTAKKAAGTGAPRTPGTGKTADQAWSQPLAAAALAATLPDGSFLIPRVEEDAITLSEIHRRLCETGVLADLLNEGKVIQKISKPSSEEQSRFKRLADGVYNSGFVLTYVDGSGDAGAEHSRFFAHKR